MLHEPYRHGCIDDRDLRAESRVIVHYMYGLMSRQGRCFTVGTIAISGSDLVMSRPSAGGKAIVVEACRRYTTTGSQTRATQTYLRPSIRHRVHQAPGLAGSEGSGLESVVGRQIFDRDLLSPHYNHALTSALNPKNRRGVGPWLSTPSSNLRKGCCYHEVAAAICWSRPAAPPSSVLRRLLRVALLAHVPGRVSETPRSARRALRASLEL